MDFIAFSPRAMPVALAMCSDNVFSLFLFSGPSAPCNLKIYYTDLHQIYSIGSCMGGLHCAFLFCACSKDVAMATNFRGKMGLFTFIHHPGIPKQIGILQFRFQKIQWQLFLYIVCKFGEVRNPRVHEDAARRSGVGLFSVRSLGGDTARHCTGK